MSSLYFSELWLRACEFHHRRPGAVFVAGALSVGILSTGYAFALSFNFSIDSIDKLMQPGYQTISDLQRSRDLDRLMPTVVDEPIQRLLSRRDGT